MRQKGVKLVIGGSKQGFIFSIGVSLSKFCASSSNENLVAENLCVRWIATFFEL